MANKKKDKSTNNYLQKAKHKVKDTTSRVNTEAPQWGAVPVPTNISIIYINGYLILVKYTFPFHIMILVCTI